MVPLKALGGTSDILPEEAKRWQNLETVARRILDLYGYQEIRTPLIEEAAVFTSSLGEAAEIVTKQMYLFQDRGGRHVALRPEGTASVVRAFIEHGLDRTGGLTKVYYIGPMFRAERPQAGRRRQFHQLGVEVFGSSSPYQDVEAMALMMDLLDGFEVSQEAFLWVNNIGGPEDRATIQKKLRDYFLPHVNDLCSDCRQRLEMNPLRILDCKNERCRGIAKEGITMEAWKRWLCRSCNEHFEKVVAALDKMEVKWNPDPHLVRGLDYYTRTAFEVTCTGLGAQNTVGGGGRYDNLVELLGGTTTPAIGFAIGIERVLMAQESGDQTAPILNPVPQVFVATVTPSQIPDALKLTDSLRKHGIPASVNLEDRPLDRQFRQAAKLAVKYALVLGPDEVNAGVVTVKNMTTGHQDKKVLSGLIPNLKAEFSP